MNLERKRKYHQSTAMQTANGLYPYSFIIKGRKIIDWANLVHQERLKRMGWKYSPLKMGSITLDYLIMCVGELNKEIQTLELKNSADYVEIAAYFVHRAKQQNLKWWIEQTPWQLDYQSYSKPTSTLNNHETTVKYNELDQEETKTCRMLGEIILQLLCNF
jgi:hypothetical protein